MHGDAVGPAGGDEIILDPVGAQRPRDDRQHDSSASHVVVKDGIAIGIPHDQEQDVPALDAVHCHDIPEKRIRGREPDVASSHEIAADRVVGARVSVLSIQYRSSVPHVAGGGGEDEVEDDSRRGVSRAAAPIHWWRVP